MPSRCAAIRDFYKSEAWRKARAEKILSCNGLCEVCGRPGDEVHHVNPLTPENVCDPEVSLGQGNLMLLCKECHNEMHGRFMSEPRFDLEGNPLPPPGEADEKTARVPRRATSEIRGADFLENPYAGKGGRKP